MNAYRGGTGRVNAVNLWYSYIPLAIPMITPIAPMIPTISPMIDVIDVILGASPLPARMLTERKKESASND